MAEAISFRAHVMAVDRVERRLRRVTAALDAAGIRYAVIGGNAVAAWVGRTRPSATRATKDVDLLVQRDDETRITHALEAMGFMRQDLRGLVIFLDPEEPDRRSGVHLVWAGERVRPSNPVPAPSLDEAVLDPQGFWVLNLPALVRMKLTAFRPIDQAHLIDLLELGLIDESMRSSLPPLLRERLETTQQSAEDSEG